MHKNWGKKEKKRERDREKKKHMHLTSMNPQSGFIPHLSVLSFIALLIFKAFKL